MLGRIGPHLTERELQDRDLIVRKLPARINALRGPAEHITNPIGRLVRRLGLNGIAAIINENQEAGHIYPLLRCFSFSAVPGLSAARSSDNGDPGPAKPSVVSLDHLVGAAKK